jgi:hypothetical protein
VFRLPNALPNREEGEPNPHYKWHPSLGERVSIALAQPATAQSRTAQTSTVADLARFFPEATPVRIPVQFTRRNHTTSGNQPGGDGVQESTVIEFGTSREVLFACTTPLEFADILRLRNSDGSLDTEASVVAVQYHPGNTIVAARFLTSVPNWIVQP